MQLGILIHPGTSLLPKMDSLSSFVLKAQGEAETPVASFSNKTQSIGCNFMESGSSSLYATQMIPAVTLKGQLSFQQEIA